MLKRIRENKKGFTLAELLIVVAIIGVLAAISIPIFTTQLEKAREATDVSNMRAAYAVAQADVLTEGYKDTTAYTSGTGGYTGYYDLAGKIAAAKPDGYGKSSVTGLQSTVDLPTNATFTWDGKAKDKVIKVVINPDAADGKYATVSWE